MPGRIVLKLSLSKDARRFCSNAEDIPAAKTIGAPPLRR